MNNIKRIIFDLDTLIIWKDEYNQALRETIKEYKLKYSSTIIDKIIKTYEIDMLGALNAGLNVIHVSKKEPIQGITTIKDITELKRIL